MRTQSSGERLPFDPRLSRFPACAGSEALGFRRDMTPEKKLRIFRLLCLASARADTERYLLQHAHAAGYEAAHTTRILSRTGMSMHATGDAAHTYKYPTAGLDG